MKKYKSKFQEYFKQILSYKNHKIFDVEHSVERYKERIPIPDIPAYYNLLKKGINWIIERNKEYEEDRYIFISRKHGFGIQVHWREDRFSKEFNGYSATTFSNDEMNFFTKADKEVFLENFKINMIDNKPKSKLTELLAETSIDRIYYLYKFENELKEETELINMDMFIEDGKVYHTYKFVRL